MTAHRAPLDAIEAAVAGGVLPPGGRLLLGCSGGRDSMAMLHALLAVGRWSVGVATVDHGLHGRARATADWVVEVARRLGVAAWRLVADQALIAQGAGVEDGARRARYAVLEAQADAWAAGVIVVAHTADDQAETLLMRLGEGTGLRGLGGMRARRGRVARPWLGVSRAAVARYAEAAGVEWVEDPTNADRRFRRNALRGAVMPGMAQVFGERGVERVAAAAERLAGAQALLDWCLTAHRLVVEGDDAIEVPGATLGQMPVAARGGVLAHALGLAARRWAPGAGRRVALHVERISAQLDEGDGVLSLPGGLRAVVTARGVTIEPAAVDEPSPASITIAAPGRWRWGRFEVRVSPATSRPAAPEGDHVGCAAAPMPWVLRTARRGDRFRALGAPGRRPVTRAWRDAGVPASDRATLPVIESAGELVWVGALRPSEHVRVGVGEPAWRIELIEKFELESDGSDGE